MGNKEGNDSVPFLFIFCLGKGKVIRLLLPNTGLLIFNKREFKWVMTIILKKECPKIARYELSEYYTCLFNIVLPSSPKIRSGACFLQQSN